MLAPHGLHISSLGRLMHHLGQVVGGDAVGAKHSTRGRSSGLGRAQPAAEARLDEAEAA
jgi:hypothetical protein